MLRKNIVPDNFVKMTAGTVIITAMRIGQTTGHFFNCPEKEKTPATKSQANAIASNQSKMYPIENSLIVSFYQSKAKQGREDFYLKTVAVVGVDEGADFFAVEGLGPFVDEFQLFDLGAQEIAEIAVQDFAEHGFDGQKLGLLRPSVEERRQVGGFIGGDALGEHVLPLHVRLLADIVGFADGVQGLGVVAGLGQFQKFKYFVLRHGIPNGPGPGLIIINYTLIQRGTQRSFYVNRRFKNLKDSKPEGASEASGQAGRNQKID